MLVDWVPLDAKKRSMNLLFPPNTFERFRYFKLLEEGQKNKKSPLANVNTMVAFSGIKYLNLVSPQTLYDPVHLDASPPVVNKA